MVQYREEKAFSHRAERKDGWMRSSLSWNNSVD
jgi:hypothetical protein